jgi:hypothetical protein
MIYLLIIIIIITETLVEDTAFRFIKQVMRCLKNAVL